MSKLYRQPSAPAPGVSASPVDTTIIEGSAAAPELPGATVDPLVQIADEMTASFGSLSQSLVGFGFADKRKREKDVAEGYKLGEEMAALNEDMAKLVEAGTMQPHENPRIQEGMMRAIGDSLASRALSSFDSSVETFRQQNTEFGTLEGGLAFFDSEMNSFLERAGVPAGDQDVIRRGFAVKIGAYRQRFANEQNAYVGRVALEETKRGFTAEVRDIALNGNKILSEVQDPEKREEVIQQLAATISASIQDTPTSYGPPQWPLSYSLKSRLVVDSLIDLAKTDHRATAVVLDVLDRVETGPPDSRAPLGGYLDSALEEARPQLDDRLAYAARGGNTIPQFLSATEDSLRDLASTVLVNLSAMPGYAQNTGSLIRNAVRRELLGTSSNGLYRVDEDAGRFFIVSTEDGSRRELSIDAIEDRMKFARERTVLNGHFDTYGKAPEQLGAGFAATHAQLGELTSETNEMLAGFARVNPQVLIASLDSEDEQQQVSAQQQINNLQTAYSYYKSMIENGMAPPRNLGPDVDLLISVLDHGERERPGSSFSKPAIREAMMGLNELLTNREAMQNASNAFDEHTERLGSYIDLGESHRKLIKKHTIMLAAARGMDIEKAMAQTMLLMDNFPQFGPDNHVSQAELNALPETEAELAVRLANGGFEQDRRIGSIPAFVQEEIEASGLSEKISSNPEELRFDLEGSEFVVEFDRIKVARFSLDEYYAENIRRLQGAASRTGDEVRGSLRGDSDIVEAALPRRTVFAGGVTDQVLGTLLVGGAAIKRISKDKGQETRLKEYAAHLARQDGKEYRPGAKMDIVDIRTRDAGSGELVKFQVDVTAEYLARAARKRNEILEQVFRENIDRKDEAGFMDMIISMTNERIEQIVEPPTPVSFTGAGDTARERASSGEGAAFANAMFDKVNSAVSSVAEALGFGD
jgi:hypothetical protein